MLQKQIEINPKFGTISIKLSPMAVLLVDNASVFLYSMDYDDLEETVL
jgi:ascorbate-specific PTS system EIIC-type component UlaA